MEISGWLILAFAAMALSASLRIARENERFIVTALGRFKTIVGPGLLFRIPFSPEKWQRIRIGEIGIYLGEGQASFGDAVVPVAEADFSPQTSVVVSSFREGKIFVSRSTVRVVVCEKCGHENRISA